MQHLVFHTSGVKHYCNLDDLKEMQEGNLTGKLFNLLLQQMLLEK